MNRKVAKSAKLRRYEIEPGNLQIAGICTLNSPICKTLIPAGNNECFKIEKICVFPTKWLMV
jgi:hypothetical protein